MSAFPSSYPQALVFWDYFLLGSLKAACPKHALNTQYTHTQSPLKVLATGHVWVSWLHFALHPPLCHCKAYSISSSFNWTVHTQVCHCDHKGRKDTQVTTHRPTGDDSPTLRRRLTDSQATTHRPDNSIGFINLLLRPVSRTLCGGRSPDVIKTLNRCPLSSAATMFSTFSHVTLEETFESSSKSEHRSSICFSGATTYAALWA